MTRRLFSFKPAHQPYMVRHSYVHELRSAATYPLAAALAEGAFTSVVAAKYFDASPLLVAVITAAPMFGNIAALFWSQLSQRHPRVRFVNWLQLGVIGSIASVSLTYLLPRENPWAAWTFAGLIILARVLAAGIVTVRSAIWRFNYPRHVRAQVIARISAVATATLAVTTLVGAKWLDAQPEAYAILYPIAALLGVVGIWQFSQIRVRHEWKLLRGGESHAVRPENIAQTEEANVLNYAPVKKGTFWTEARQVLRDDPKFRDYMRWQFVSGTAFMMMTPPLLLMVSREMTDPKRDYLLATLIVQIIPMIVSVVFTQVWAPLFDRVSILRFRVIQGMVTVAAMATMAIGALSDQLWIIGVGQFLLGVTNAAGNLAWNLGHNDFSSPEKASTYMAVNVMLTGTRGFFAPFVGIWLYGHLVGRGIFIVCAVISLCAQAGFYWMSRQYDRKRPAVVAAGR